MTTLKLYTKGAKVWIPHKEKVWEGAELLEDYQVNKSTLTVLTEGNEKKELKLKTEKDLPFLRNPSILIGENDLTSLSYLHEPAVLHNLQVRFCQHKHIYTYCGIVLVAINPYDDLPIYDVDTIQTYRGQAMGDLDPHIFAVAEDAYTELERARRDQSIIVSGESGAGKTVSAKYTMRYFATVGGNATETQIERRVLASSPIMEAIGNAKTTRNDNSSRFGKFIELHFDKQFRISGASMRTYLLEKSRVVFQSPDERNYHIFYQICAARDRFPHLCLDHQDKFNYLNQGQSPYVTGVDDLIGFEETIEALKILRFSDTQIEDMLKVLAVILHLGNIEFEECMIKMENEQNQEGCKVKANDVHMTKLAELLEIDEEEIRIWLCTRRLVSMRDIVMKPMSVKEAESARDALGKHIYAQLFNWIVLVINKELEVDTNKHKFIGVLDIYGFETFEINSFEQFCINYANEKLQQQFNLHVFKLEQEEYIKEGIEWTMIDFYDNQPCIDLIETKLGILDLLDEECRMPKGSDGSWTEKLYLKCCKYSHFSKGRFGSSSFVIDHFADRVQYESNGFLDKNRDTVFEEQISVIKQSKNNLVKRLFASDSQKLAVPGKKVKISPALPAVVTQKTHKKSVGSQFRDSLNMLMITLNATTPHYVRCIKPNDDKRAFEYNPKRAVQQLRACGVLETIRISAAGFPSRWSYADFFSRYRVLCRFKEIDKKNISKTCEKIITKHINNPDLYQFGRTKIFFRAGQVAYLEKLRADKLKYCCIMMQKTVRAFIYRKRYLKMKKTAMLLQRYGRGVMARRLAQDIRRNRAAITIQRYVRGWIQRKWYVFVRSCISGLQTHAKGYLARLYFLNLKYNAKAIIIQKHVRGWLARRQYNRRQRQIIVCQAAVRRFLARRLYRKLRIEARSIEHVKNLNKGLENKIISLQQKIDELTRTNHELKVYQNEVQDLKNKMITYRALEIENKNLNNLLIEKNKSISKLEDVIKSDKDEKVDLVNELEKYQLEMKNQRALWKQETDVLRKELNELNEIVKVNEKTKEDNTRIKLEEETTMMITESNKDKEDYQRLINDYYTLEQYCEELQRQLESQKHLGGHQRNISDVSSISGMDEGMFNTISIPEDHGYGSVRSNAGADSLAREKVDQIDWKMGEGSSESQTPSTASSDINNKNENDGGKVEIGLVLKLQHKLAEVEREKERMQKRLDEIDMSPKMERVKSEAELTIKISELEMCNSQLKAQLYELQESITDGTGSVKLLEQLVAMREESDRKSEEIVQLKGVLANQANNMKSILNAKTRTGEYINEDGELAQAYETQKTINKQLELELQDEKARYKAHEKEYKYEIEKLREDNERQQRILSANLTSNPQSQSEAYMQLEITRLTQENLQIIDKNDLLNESLKKLKKQIKVLMKKLEELGVDPHNYSLQAETATAVPTQRSKSKIRKKDSEYLGMFSIRDGEETMAMNRLVIDLKPRTAVSLLPALPSYIVFMCIRYADHMNDEEKVKVLLSSFLSSVRKVLRKRSDDFETRALWLSNMQRFLCNLKQYSGEKIFQEDNTPKQNEQCLRNFDLSDYRTVASDTAIYIYQEIMKVLEHKVHPLIVPAILEYEEVSGGVNTTNPEVNYTRTLCKELTGHYKILQFYGVSTDMISQIFKQLYYFMCACSLNNLLLRKELCNWSKGYQIRHNLSHLEMWTREKNLDEESIKSMLQPIIQAAQLLQARKSDEDVTSICDMCSALTPLQTLKILTLYTPTDDCDQRVSHAFIKKVQEKLQQRGDSSNQQSLMMDIKHRTPVQFSYKSSDICLEDIEIPEVLNLPMLEKI